MNLSKFALENSKFTIIVFLLLVLFGIISFLTMPRSEDPLIDPAGTNVVVVFPGANPVDLEQLVIDPIEKVINELEDIKEIKTTAESGLAFISVEFLPGSDGDEKYSDVVQKVNSVVNDLPDGIVKFELMKWSITDVKILQLGLVSDTEPYNKLEDEAERLEDLFNNIKGVKDVDIMAYPKQQISIDVDLERMSVLNITMNDIINAVNMNNANIPGGYVEIGKKRFSIQTSGSYESINEIKQTPISLVKEQVVYIKDIAKVYFDFEDEKYIGRTNGKRSLFIAVSQKAGMNIFDVSNQLKLKIDEFKEELSSSVSVITVFDQSENVARRLNDFFINLLQGLFLVGLVFLLGVNFRASLVVITAIPISILIGIGAIDIGGYGLQQISIAGLVIALGLIVDNAIVVTENITNFMKKGYDAKSAAFEATNQISGAITSSTVTTVLAFIPIIFMGDVTGDFIRSMPLIVVFTLIASLFVSLSLTPYLSSIFLPMADKIKESKVQKLFSSFIENVYQKQLAYTLSKPRSFIILAVVVFFASLTLFPLVGVSFFPKAEKPQFLININTPESIGLAATDSLTAYLEKKLLSNPNIRTVAANIGRDNPRIYYNSIPKSEKYNRAQILVELSNHDLELLDKTIKDLRKEFSGIPDVKVEVKEFEQGPPVDAPVAIRIIGENLSTLEKISKDIEDIFQKTEGIINVNNPLGTSKTDLYVKINREKAAIYGVPIIEIDRTVRAVFAGINISKFRDSKGKEYNITISIPNDGKRKYQDFNKIYVSSVTGNLIPLKQIAEIEFKAGPNVISHYNLNRNVTITADTDGSREVNDVTMEIINKLDRYNFPEGYRYKDTGELQSRQSSFGGMAQATLVALLGIFAVLVLQFKSYKQPLIIFSAIPLALVGSILALFITGYSFSFMAFVGLTSLVGIVVNNSIILVDYTNQLLATEFELDDAIIEAAKTRFTPIFLTTATTIGGLLPLTFSGGTLWAPMGWTIIGGMIVSTFLTLIIVPALYKLFTDNK